MTSPLNWKDFLNTAGLPEGANCLTVVNTGHALVKVTGSDAENFLHAQLSNSVTGLKQGEIRFGAWCNAKGRVWTLLRYWKDESAIILRMPTDQVEDTVKRLRMFVLRSDVQLEALDLTATQFIGPEAENAAEAYKAIYGISLPGAWPIHEIWTEHPVESDLPELPEEFLALPRILAGVPEVFAGQREEWIPQMLNLDNSGGIDFKKGCYPGQEIVAKLHYKGGLKQRLFTGSIETQASALTAGEDITDSDDKKLGSVVEAAQLGERTYLTLVLRLEARNRELSVANQTLNIQSD